MLIFVVFIALLSLIFGGILALKISHSVTENVKGMAKDMDALANDNLNIEIKGAEHEHELGLMAKALTIFRTNGLRIRKLAEEKAQADAIAAQERMEENKRVKMMDELQSSLGSVVNKAVAGDFSNRVPTSFSDKTLNNLAQGVNLLLETTENGLNETLHILSAMSQGNLTARIEAEYQGAF